MILVSIKLHSWVERSANDCSRTERSGKELEKRQESVARDFDPEQDLENADILCVFQVFQAQSRVERSANDRSRFSNYLPYNKKEGQSWTLAVVAIYRAEVDCASGLGADF